MKYGIGLCLLAISTGTAYCMNEATNAAAVISVEHIKQKLQEERNLIERHNQQLAPYNPQEVRDFRNLVATNRDTISAFIAQQHERNDIQALQAAFSNFMEEARRHPKYPGSTRQEADSKLLAQINQCLAPNPNNKGNVTPFNPRTTMDGIESMNHLRGQKQQLLQELRRIEQQQKTIQPFLKQKISDKKVMAQQEQEKLNNLHQQQSDIEQQIKALQEKAAQTTQSIQQTSYYINTLNSDTSTITSLLEDGWVTI